MEHISNKNECIQFYFVYNLSLYYLMMIYTLMLYTLCIRNIYLPCTIYINFCIEIKKGLIIET